MSKVQTAGVATHSLNFDLERVRDRVQAYTDAHRVEGAYQPLEADMVGLFEDLITATTCIRIAVTPQSLPLLIKTLIEAGLTGVDFSTASLQ